MAKKTYEKHNYLNKNIKYINNSIIREYDMKNAGPSILLHYELISQKEYDGLMKLDKHTRSVTVGKFLKVNPEISEALMEGFVEMRKEFFNLNNIEDSDILSIKKDAIFLINTIPKVTQINEECLFRNKNEYTSYLNIRNKEFYYDSLTDNFEIKGLPKEVVKSQEEFFIKFIKECIKLGSQNKKEELFIKFLEFKNSFINKELDIEFYRDITTNKFIFTHNNYILSLDDMKNISLKENKYISIENNLNFLLEMISDMLS